MRQMFSLAVIAMLWCGPAALADSCSETCPANCPEKNHEVTKTITDASLTGTIKCNHCDLHRGKTCQKVLETTDNKFFQFCPQSVKAEDLDKLRDKQVQVKGTIKELKGADPVIHVASMQPVS